MSHHAPELPPDAPKHTIGLRDPRFGKPPKLAIQVLIILVVASWIPLAFAFRGKFTTSTEPRIHIFQDMDNQPKLKPQQEASIFLDGRAMRPKIAGTVARAQLQDDDHYYRGYVMKTGADGKPAAEFFPEFPKQVKVDAALLARGQERYNIYCATCHGLDGGGNGPVNRRGLEIGGWVQAAKLSDSPFRERPAGHIYNTIVNGIRNMGPYGSQIQDAQDRWAVVAYVRALQLAGNAPVELAPAEKVRDLK